MMVREEGYPHFFLTRVDSFVKNSYATLRFTFLIAAYL